MENEEERSKMDEGEIRDNSEERRERSGTGARTESTRECPSGEARKHIGELATATMYVLTSSHAETK